MQQAVEDTTDQIFNVAFGGLSIAEMNVFQRLVEKYALAVRQTESLAK